MNRPKITLYNDQPATTTSVPNLFIDEYMTQANGEYVKIYLYLLRNLSRPDGGFSLSQIADHFDCTERDILRALMYWERLQLFRLEYDSGKNLSGICFLTDALRGTLEQQEAEPEDSANRFIRATGPDTADYSADAIRAFCSKEDIHELVYVAEQYLCRTLNHNDLNTLFFWYDRLSFSTELIEFLIETSVSRGHTSLRYMHKIAEDYAQRGVRTVQEAKQLQLHTSTLYSTVMKAFGIRGRHLVPSETSFLKQWSTGFGFDAEMIREACTRTINTIHEPNFGYAHSILEKWHNQGIHTMEEVKKADEAFQQSQRRRRPASTGSAGTANRFINFPQRENDYEEIQQLLVQNSLQ